MAKKKPSKPASIDFTNAGAEKSKINVTISYRIIQLFSEGLYSSPHKAVEELVSNSFDAGATSVHVLLSPDLGKNDATVVVIDNGSGMNADELQRHWLIGVSEKRQRVESKGARQQIGKFGIGKLATFVLAKRFTHITKSKGVYYGVSMNYAEIPDGQEGISTKEDVQLSLRVLSEKEAQTALAPWLNGSGPGYDALKLFGPKAAKSWTVAIMSDLKTMASQIKMGRLRWILQNAMPLRDDFKLYLNGAKIEPAKLQKPKRRWVLGKDITEKQLAKPAPADITSTKAGGKFALLHPQLGRIDGYAEGYDSLLTDGSESDQLRSHGFFVYVRGRLVNLQDEHFGISPNALKHGIFNRFRMVVNIDALDEELRSSRETVRDGPLVVLARDLLHAVFNIVRNSMEEAEAKESPEAQISRRFSGTPHSLTRRPLYALVSAAFKGAYKPRYVTYPESLSQKEQEKFLDAFGKRIDTLEDGFITDVSLVDLGADQGIAALNIANGALHINTRHPFVAYFIEDYENQKQRLPLQIYAMAEILMEGQLLQAGLPADQITDTLNRRDATLRYFARSGDKRTAVHVAQELLDSSSDPNAFETATVAAFDSLGFDAVPDGRNGKSDGYAEAILAANSDGKQSYKVSLEAKSKKDLNAKVTAKAVGVSTIARQRDDSSSDHALVVGPDFPTTAGEVSALAKEMTADRKNTGKTITLIRTADLATLVRTAAAKRVSPAKIRELLKTCATPEQSAEWVKKLLEEAPAREDHKKEILQTIWQLQHEDQDEPPAYSAIKVKLRDVHKITMSTNELSEECNALARMTASVVAHSTSVELNRKPEQILAEISQSFQDYPENEKKFLHL